MGVLLDILLASYEVLLASGFYILVGLTVASLIHAFITADTIAKYLGEDKLRSVFLSALFGVPLPLCSCSVVPTALSLRDKGASPGSVAAFLISTPESGVDSISVTYALMNPIMAVARPLAAFASAFLAGALVHFGGVGAGTPSVAAKSGCCHLKDSTAPIQNKFVLGFHYGFVELLGYFGKWFLIGILMAGVITVLMPQHWIESYLSGGSVSYLVALIAGIPLYICATSSTPVAAALILKGMSPGVALVFLMAGPATNAASLVVLLKTFGKKFLAIYLGSVMVMALLAGYSLDLLIAHFQWDFPVLSGHAMKMLPFEAQLAASVLFLALTFRALFRKGEKHF